jgi:hypothetical protein
VTGLPFPLPAPSGSRRATVWALAVLLAGAAAAPGALLPSHLRGEARAEKVAQADGGAIRFTVEARPGGSGGGSLAARRLPTDPPAASVPFDPWPNGEPVPFVLAYDGRRTVTLSLFQGDREVRVSSVSDRLADCNELFVSAVAAAPGSRAIVSGLRLGEAPVGDAPAATPPVGEDVLRIPAAAGLARGFTLTGAMVLGWEGAPPREGDLHVRLWGARVKAPPPRPPGRIAITAPAPASVLAEGAPTLTAAFAGPAVDPAAVVLMLDGADRTAQAEIASSGLTFTPPARLLEGKHTAQVIVRGADGGEEQAAVSFTTDTVPPSIAFASPPREVAGNPAPIIRLTYSDLTSGLDASTLKVTLDGESIDSICVANLASGVCIPQSIPEGSHLLTATIRDRAGNAATATFSFNLTLGEEPQP